MKPVWRNILGPGLSLILFAAAVWLLHKELRAYHLRDILHAFDAISGRISVGSHRVDHTKLRCDDRL